MEINIKDLKKIIDSINYDLKDFESYIYDLISSIKNTSFYWHDGYTTSFFNQIDGLQDDVNELMNFLYSILNTLRVIYSYYNNINNIKGDIGVYGIVKDDDFYEKSYDDEATLEKKRNIRNKIIYAEDDISYSIGKINEIFIRNINFDDLMIDQGDSDFVGMLENMPSEINKFEAKLESFNMHYDGLLNGLYSIQNVYDSVNARKLLLKTDSISDCMNILNVNFNNAIDYINSRKKEYISVFEDMAGEALKGVDL